MWFECLLPSHQGDLWMILFTTTVDLWMVLVRGCITMGLKGLSDLLITACWSVGWCWNLPMTEVTSAWRRLITRSRTHSGCLLIWLWRWWCWRWRGSIHIWIFFEINLIMHCIPEVKNWMCSKKCSEYVRLCCWLITYLFEDPITSLLLGVRKGLFHFVVY